MTVEWVAIAAAVVVGAVAMTWLVLQNLTPTANAIGTQLDGVTGTLPNGPTITAPNFNPAP